MNTRLLHGSAGVSLLAAVTALAADNATLANPPKPKVESLVPLKAQPFPLEEVRRLAGPFRDAMERNERYLLSLDPDRLLHTFRLNVGLPSSAKPYGGWEDPKIEVRGHSLGHYLSALALTYASTGDVRFKARTDAIVTELAKCQAASPQAGFHAGYLSAFPESFIDRVETRQPVWAPWYTLHKIMAGLLAVYRHCDNAQALDVLVKMADWIKFRVDRLTAEQMQASLDAEFGGMNEVLANLYAVTGNPEHLKLAEAFDHRRMFDPLAAGEDKLNGFHANTQIPKMIGAAREYELTGQSRYGDIARFFWERVAEHRSYVIGGHSDGEHFFPPEEFSRHLTTDTAETCNTYNMLKLTRHVFEWEPSARMMDFYERALYNHILASQDPQTGMFVYLMSLKPGHFKTYSMPDNSFWCCVGTGMENHAKYADTIFFHSAESLYLNLFIPAELSWRERGVTVRQETRFPDEGRSRLSFHCAQPVDLALKIRRPAWAGDGFALLVNGNAQAITEPPGSYVEIHRTWKTGDRVEVRLPMQLHTEAMPDDPSVLALMCGPIVLAGELGKADMPSPYARGQTDLNGVPSPAVPVFVTDAKDWLSQVKPVALKPLRFRTAGLGRPTDVRLIPFFRMHHQRYTVYWKLMTPTQYQQRAAELAAAEKQRQELERITVDVVHPGEQQSETDHAFAGEATQTGTYQGRRWRHSGGWFSYRLKVPPDKPVNLVCTWWGGDSGSRTFDLLVDGQKIATERLENNRPGQFYDQAYPLPPDLTHDKTGVEVKLQAHPGNLAGGLYGLRIVERTTQ